MAEWPRIGIAIGGLLAYSLLAIFMIKLRRKSNVRRQGIEVPRSDPYLRRTDLLDEGHAPNNVLERIVTVSANPTAQGIVLLFVASVTVALSFLGYSDAAGVGVYFTLVALLVMLLFYGWDRLEALFDSEEATNLENRRVRDEALPLAVAYRLSTARHGSTNHRTKSPTRGWKEVKITIVLVGLMVIFLALLLLLFTAVFG